MIKQIRASYFANFKNAQYCALSSDSIPDYLENGDEVYIINTGKNYIYDASSSSLFEKPITGLPSGGTAGQVLGLDDQLQPVWMDQTGGDDVAPVILNTASGAIASFSDGADSMPIRKLVAQIEPVQDLHGYDNPWPAGAGKNKFDVNKLVNTSDITVNNGVISVTGNSKNSTKKLSELADLSVGEAYILTATSTQNQNLIYLYGTGANISWVFGVTQTITQEMLDALVFFYGGVAGGVDTTAQITNFMIRLATETDA